MMNKEITIYRVRKEFNDIKSQKGAFFLLAAAITTAKKYNLSVYDNSGKLIFSPNKDMKKPLGE